MAVGSDLLQVRCPAETPYILIGARLTLAAPGMIRARNLIDVELGELFARAVNHVAKLSGVNEQDFVPPIPKLRISGDTIRFVARKEPQAYGYLCRVKKLTG